MKEKKAAEKFYMLWWHSSAALGCYFVMKDEAWVPWYLGGTKDGTIENGLENMPFTPISPACYLLGLILLGKPVQQTFTHFFVFERNPDFAEMSLHHLAHLSLASGYLMANMIPIGTLIAFLHDFSDIFV